MIRLIVTDIDGTLVKDGSGPGSLNTEYFEVISKLMDKGIIFVAASGRQYTSISRLFRPVSDRIHYATEGGSVVFYQGKMLYSNPLAQCEIDEALYDIERLSECDVIACGKETAYVRKEDSPLYRFMKDEYKYEIEAIGSLRRAWENEIVKISIFHEGGQVEERTKGWFLDKWNQRLQVSLAGLQWLDLVPNDASKGVAVEFLQKQYGISSQETMVFGDNCNDIPMFGKAHYSYAVRNARLDVKNQARYVCGSYEEDGVLAILKEVLENGEF